MNKLPMLFCWSFDIQYTDRPEEEYLTQTEFIFQCLEKSDIYMKAGLWAQLLPISKQFMDS